MFPEFCTIEALSLRPGSKELEAFNVERVRVYLERNLGCKKKEVIHALGLHPRTVAKAIKIVQARSSTSGPARHELFIPPLPPAELQRRR